MGLYKLVVLCVCVEWLFSMGTMCLCGVAVLYGYYVPVWSGCSLWVLCACVEWLFSMGTMCLCGVAVLCGYFDGCVVSLCHALAL